jgi:hypothetical protein
VLARLVHSPSSFTYSAMLSQSEHACNPVNLQNQCGSCCLVYGKYHDRDSFASTAEAVHGLGCLMGACLTQE